MDILNHALTLAGVPADKITEIIGNEALKGVEIPDDITVQVKNSLTNLERAKAHPDVANHFKGTHFGMIDNATKQSLADAGFDESAISDIFNSRKTTERISEAIKQAQALGAKGAGKETSTQVEELRALLKQQEQAVSAKEAEYSTIIKQKDDALNRLQYSHALGSALSSSGLKFKDLPSDLLKVSANHLINSKLSELNAKAVTINGKIALVRADDPTQEHYTGAEKTDFYTLLPNWLESIVDKSNGTTTGQTTTIPKINTLDRAAQARANNLANIGK